MYIILNDTKYSDITGMSRNVPVEVSYYGEGLTGIESVSGVIQCFTEDGFLHCEDDVSDYARVVISDGRITITNRPEPQPDPPEPEPEPDVWTEIANAIRNGVNSVD